MRWSVSLAGGGLVILIVTLVLTGTSAQEDTSAAAEIEHGRYLVHQVCLCVICHTARDARGEPIESRLLMGGTIPLDSPYRGVEWAFRAPRLVGLPAGWTEDEFVQFLQTTEPPHGRSVRLPMPPFRLQERDARAVAAYLLSLR